MTAPHVEDEAALWELCEAERGVFRNATSYRCLKDVVDFNHGAAQCAPISRAELCQGCYLSMIKGMAFLMQQALNRNDDLHLKINIVQGMA